MLTAKERIEDYEWCIVQLQKGRKLGVCELLSEVLYFKKKVYDFRTTLKSYPEFENINPKPTVEWDGYGWEIIPFDFTSRIAALRKAIEETKNK